MDSDKLGDKSTIGILDPTRVSQASQRQCPFYRVNGERGGGSTQVLVGHFKLFGYERGRVKLINTLVLLVAYDF
jgi:hypothetical protein